MKITKSLLTCFMILLLLLLGTTNEGLSETISRRAILFDESREEFWAGLIELGYARLAQELREDGYIVESLKNGPITRDKLSGYAVLAVVNPWAPFQETEIEAIKKFVETGGGLLIIGLGWSWVDYKKQSIDKHPANQLGRFFGITTNDDIVMDPTDHEGDLGFPIFYEFTDHPVTVDIRKVSTINGNPSSLNISGSAIPVVRGDFDSFSGYRVKVYGSGSSPPVVAAARYGKGSVIFASHDAFFAVTQFGNNLYQYDNLKLAKNIFAWLARNAPPATSIQSVSTRFIITTVTATAFRTQATVTTFVTTAIEVVPLSELRNPWSRVEQVILTLVVSTLVGALLVPYVRRRLRKTDYTS